MMTLLLTWSKIFCVKKGRLNGVSLVQMWFSHLSLLSFIDRWYQKAEAKHPSFADWLRKNINCIELLILNFLSPNFWPSHHLTAEVTLSPEGRPRKWWGKEVGQMVSQLPAMCPEFFLSPAVSTFLYKRGSSSNYGHPSTGPHLPFGNEVLLD